jgi:hypothetical protein
MWNFNDLETQREIAHTIVQILKNKSIWKKR